MHSIDPILVWIRKENCEQSLTRILEACVVGARIKRAAKQGEIGRVRQKAPMPRR